jgi:hypothetical protein
LNDVAFIRATVKLILRERTAYDYQSPVLCLGVPEVYVTANELEDWCRTFSGRPSHVSVAEMELTRHPTGSRLGWVSADTFFKALGLEEVHTVDIPGAEQSTGMVHDLNEPFPVKMHGKFRLVLDPGTTEHVFDMKTCLTNVVRVLDIGGTVIHQVPVYSYNGGYYSMNPSVLHDFYAANGFADIRSFVLMWDRYHPYTGSIRVYPYDEGVLGSRHALADRDQVRYTPMLLTFARKHEEVKTIKSPLQYEGAYISGGGISPASSSTFQRLLTTASLKIEQSRWHAARSVKMRLGRRVRLWRSRRRSFWL